MFYNIRNAIFEKKPSTTIRKLLLKMCSFHKKVVLIEKVLAKHQHKSFYYQKTTIFEDILLSFIPKLSQIVAMCISSARPGKDT